MRILFTTLLLSFASLAGAQTAEKLLASGDIAIRAYTDPADETWFAQQTRFYVEVRTSTWFTDAPNYPELKLEGAVAKRCRTAFANGDDLKELRIL